MKINFHYHCIKALAVEAGLETREAQLVAYASQHVDDAVEHRTLTINGCDHGRRFKPVCSAHKSIWKLARAVKKPETWYKVFVPFHFIPPAPRTAGKTFSYRVKKNSGWIKRMIARAVKRIRNAEPGIERDRALVRLGILMHVYADTWSHADFSGVNSIEDNAVMEYDTNIEDDNPPISFDFPDLAVPPVGHGQALGYPDQSSRNWLVVLGKQKRRRLPRNNPQRSLDAAERIYKVFCKISGKEPKWQNLAGRIGKSLTKSASCRRSALRVWSRSFPEIVFSYDDEKWMKQAIKRTGRAMPSRRSGRRTYTATDNNAPWFHFHAEARAHREEVLKGLPAEARR